MDFDGPKPDLCERLESLLGSIDLLSLTFDTSKEGMRRKRELQHELRDLASVALSRSRWLSAWLHRANHSGRLDIDDCEFDELRKDLNEYRERSISFASEMGLDRVSEIHKELSSHMNTCSLLIK